MNFFICMLRRFPSAAYVLEMNPQKFENVLSMNSKHSSNLMHWDQYLSRLIISVLDTSDVEGKALMKQLKYDMRTLQSGRAIWSLLKEKSQVAVGAEILAIQARFDAGAYVKAGQTEGDIFMASLSFQ